MVHGSERRMVATLNKELPMRKTTTTTCRDPFEKMKHDSICENELSHNMVPALPCILPSRKIYEPVKYVGFEPE